MSYLVDPEYTTLLFAVLVNRLGGEVLITQTDIDEVAFGRLDEAGLPELDAIRITLTPLEEIKGEAGVMKGPVTPERLEAVYKAVLKLEPVTRERIQAETQFKPFWVIQCLRELRITRRVSFRKGSVASEGLWIARRALPEVDASITLPDLPPKVLDWMGYTNIKPQGGYLVRGVL